MIEWMHPALIFIFGAFLIPFLKGRTRNIYLLLLPVAAFISVLSMSPGTYGVIPFMGFDLVFGRVDKLSLVFGYIFSIMAFIGTVYGLHARKNGEHIAAFIHIGCSLGVVFAGDLLALILFWEGMAFSSVFLIWLKGGNAAYNAGIRYILAHIIGGACLLGGAFLYWNSGTIEFDALQNIGLAFYLVLIGFLINAAVPPFHAWLPDAYPEASVVGTVFLSAFTTKTAVYVLARGFPGAEILIWMGVIMALYGVVYAVLENDARRLLAYHIISQVGYMVAGVGIGTELAINGAVAHAFTNILNKALLLMGIGSVMHMTGRRKLTELGGVFKTMPVTFVLYMIGGLSISAFPLFSGFVSKSMVVSAAGESHTGSVVLLLTMASVGTFLSTGLKLPYYVFFWKDSGIEAKEPPFNMLAGMGLAAFLCIAIGVFPAPLYSLLPFPVHYEPYTPEHVVSALGVLLFTGVGFFALLNLLTPESTISADMDWFYRKKSSVFLWFARNLIIIGDNFIGGVYKFLVLEPAGKVAYYCSTSFLQRIDKILNGFARIFLDYIPNALTWFSRNPLAELKIAGDTFLFIISGKNIRPQIKERIREEKALYPGDIIKHWPIGSTVLWVTLFLLASLFIYYL